MTILQKSVDGFLGLCIEISAAFILIGLLCALYRLVAGKSLADRVVALDLISMLLVAFLALFALATAKPAYLDAAIALALTSFLATVAYARFIDRSAHQAREDEAAETAATAADAGGDA
ncbi:monovalent cation/H+ antiporter complex subunit F [Oceanomicrobium pacificus]|uniref:Multiple resistance and pH regulation protein F n=1 Tax=Oceanomicrobium pacificus TaxID=2692916 RepID=A0A6B0TPV2_9RHOB|nr:monovalent cation/H+ antiporter complex subunit F [Oceanomicrobium pacificus]MXU63878.1 multiple resistance and pH regulation protein F [Oceanomicrobium pacificus]